MSGMEVTARKVVEVITVEKVVGIESADYVFH